MMMSSLDVLTVFWRASWQSAMLAVLVFLICKISHRSISASAKTLLWTLPILRLLVLVVPASSLSIFNAATMLRGHDAVAPKHEQVFSQHPNPLAPQAMPTAPPAEEFSNYAVPSLATAKPAFTKNSDRFVTAADGLFALWFLGMAACLIRYFGAQIALHRAIASGRVVPLHNFLPREVADELSSISTRRIDLVIVERNLGPAVAGLLRPVILLPEQMIEQYSQKELKMVVLHEFEHIRRYDTVLLFVAQLVTVMHWYNPLAYWLKRQMQAQAEIAVDAATLRKLGADKVKPYAELLFKIASVNCTPANLISMARKSASFGQRIEQLAEFEYQTTLRSCLGLLAIIGVMLTGLSDATSQERTPTLPTEKSTVVGIDANASTNKPTVETTSLQEDPTLTSATQKSNVTPLSSESPVATETGDAKAIAEQRRESKATNEASQTATRTVSGRVIDSQGKGVPNASLYRMSFEGARLKVHATSDQNGEFTLPVPQRGELFDSLITWVYAEGFSLRVVALSSMIQGEGNISDVSIPLPPRASKPTHVRVSDPNGNPVVGALIFPARIELPNGSFLADEPRGLTSPILLEILESLAVRTDKDGKATIDRFTDGLWHGVACQSAEFGLQEFKHESHGEDLHLHLFPVGSIRGKIASTDAARFKQFSFGIETRTPEKYGREAAGVYRGVVNDNGEFHVPAIAAGSIASFVVASADPFMQDIELTCDDYRSKSILPNTTMELKLEAPPTVPVSGVVLTSDTRKPVSGAVIYYSRLDGPHSRRCITDETGQFRVNAVPGKVYFQMVSMGDSVGRSGRYGFGSQFPKEITQETKLEILLPVNKQVKGRLQDGSGRPLPNQKIAKLSGPYQHADGLATTDAEGKFEMYLHSRGVGGVFWAILDKTDNYKTELTVVKQMSNDDDLIVLERPAVPIAPPDLKSTIKEHIESIRRKNN